MAAICAGICSAAIVYCDIKRFKSTGLDVAWGALYGSAAHFINVIKDMDQDRASGIGGLPQRLGKRNSIVTAVVLVALGVLTIVITK